MALERSHKRSSLEAGHAFKGQIPVECNKTKIVG